MAQLAYSLDHTAATAGMRANMQSPVMADAYEVETPAGIAAGVVVSRGTADNQCVVGGTEVVGLTYRDSSPGDPTNGNAFIYAELDLAQVAIIGDFWVTVSGAVATTDTVAYNTTTGVVTAGAAGAGEADLPTWQFLTAAADGELAKVRVMPTVATIV